MRESICLLCRILIYLFASDQEKSLHQEREVKMSRKVELNQILAAITLFAFAASSSFAQDYDGEAETAITGLGGLSGLSGLGGLSALANGVVTGYAPIGTGSDVSAGSDGVYQGNGERGLGASESSDAESGDYDEDSNDSSASEEHPILSKFFNLISGGRHKRSVDEADAPNTPAEPIQAASQAHSRVKRGYKGWVPYVSTYVKTDKKAHFKWGLTELHLARAQVKAKVGKKYGK